MPCPLLIFSQSDYLTRIVAINSHTSWQTVQIQISWLLQIFLFLQKPTDLDLHCLQRQGISGFSRTRVINVKPKASLEAQWCAWGSKSHLACLSLLTLFLPEMPLLCKQSSSRSVGSALFIIQYVNLYQPGSIWLAENFKWAWHLNLFSMANIKTEQGMKVRSKYKRYGAAKQEKNPYHMCWPWNSLDQTA